MATPHKLNPKPFPTPTLTYTWPKPVFPFKGSKGRFPVEAQPYVFVSRKIAHGRNESYKLVPEMMFPIQANRQAVPDHEVLEDEYRAFHNVMVNHVILARHFLPKYDPNMLLDVKRGLPVDSVLSLEKINELRPQLPELMAYNPGCQNPPGYMYQRYKEYKQEAANIKPGPRVVLKCPPTLLIEGPFQNMVNLNTRNFCERIRDFDSAVIGRPMNRSVRIYNEPDAVSTLALEADFSQSISKRAKRVYTNPRQN